MGQYRAALRRVRCCAHCRVPDHLGDVGPDAAEVAWSAQRIATGHASRLPTQAPPGQEHISIQY
jgi:hypothetical protein